MTSLSSAQRPVASSASSHGASRPPTSARLAAVQGFDDFGQARHRRRRARRGRARARSATRSRPGRRQNHRTSRAARGRPARRQARGPGRAWPRQRTIRRSRPPMPSRAPDRARPRNTPASAAACRCATGSAAKPRAARRSGSCDGAAKSSRLRRPRLDPLATNTAKHQQAKTQPHDIVADDAISKAVEAGGQRPCLAAVPWRRPSTVRPITSVSFVFLVAGERQGARAIARFAA